MESIEKLLERHQFFHDVMNGAGRSKQITDREPPFANLIASPEKAFRLGLDFEVRENIAGHIEIARLAKGVLDNPGHRCARVKHFLGEYRNGAEGAERRVIFDDGFLATAADATVDILENHAIR
jgi:hypothetical protein